MLLFFGGIVASTLIASLAVAPFGIYHFHNTQQFAILANLIAIPICNMIVMPAALATLVAMPFGLEAAPLWVMGLGHRGDGVVRQLGRGLPGAVGRVPAIPTYAFVLMVVGGLWCALWSTRWRLLGLVPIVLGLMLAPTGRRPDVLDRARRRARRGAHRATAQLSALAGRGSNFELARWLEHDGDGRPPAEAAKASGLPLRRPRLHGARQGHAAGGRQLAGGAARRLRGGGDPGAQVPQTEGLRPAGACRSIATLSRPRRPRPPHRWRTHPRRDRGRHARRSPLGTTGSEAPMTIRPRTSDDDWRGGGVGARTW